MATKSEMAANTADSKLLHIGCDILKCISSKEMISYTFPGRFTKGVNDVFLSIQEYVFMFTHLATGCL